MKGQASLDFLFTYGWALFAILLILSAITMFGITRPQQFVSQQCYLDDSFSCLEFAGNTGSLTIHLESRVGMPINITHFEIVQVYETNCQFGDVELSPDLDERLPWHGRFNATFECVGGTNMVRGQVVRVDFMIRYQVDLEGYFPKTSNGVVVFNVG